MQRAKAEPSAQGAGSACCLPCTHTASAPDSAHTVTGEAVTCKCDSPDLTGQQWQQQVGPQANDHNRRLECLLRMALPGLCKKQTISHCLGNRWPQNFRTDYHAAKGQERHSKTVKLKRVAVMGPFNTLRTVEKSCVVRTAAHRCSTTRPHPLLSLCSGPLCSSDQNPGGKKLPPPPALCRQTAAAPFTG